MEFEFFKYADDISHEWNTFVMEAKNGSIHQISVWKNFQERIPGRGPILGFGARDSKNKEILATVFCIKMATELLDTFWWYSPRGPVFDLVKSADAGKFLIEEVGKMLRKTDGIFWRFDPYLPPEFKLSGIQTQITIQDYQPTDTLMLDLTKSDEQLLSEMKRKGRYNVNLANRKGIQIITIPDGKFSEEDLDDFWRLNLETTGRDEFSGHEKSYYEHFLRELKKYAVLFFAEYEGKRIAAAISTFCEEKAIYYFGASTSDSNYRNLMAPYLLQWEMIRRPCWQRDC